MNYLTKITRWIEDTSKIGGIIGTIALVSIMLIVVANIIFRLTGHVIPGTYEMVSAISVVTVAFALGYAAVEGSHVVITSLVDKVPQRFRRILKIFTGILHLCVWGLVFWGALSITLERWSTSEASQTIFLPYPPFRVIFTVGLLIFSVVILLNMFKLLKRRHQP